MAFFMKTRPGMTRIWGQITWYHFSGIQVWFRICVAHHHHMSSRTDHFIWISTLLGVCLSSVVCQIISSCLSNPKRFSSQKQNWKWYLDCLIMTCNRNPCPAIPPGPPSIVINAEYLQNGAPSTPKSCNFYSWERWGHCLLLLPLLRFCQFSCHEIKIS